MRILSHPSNLAVVQAANKLTQTTRDFFAEQGYVGLDLPVLSPSIIPESYLEIFETEFTYLDKKTKLYLTPSPELFIKRLLADGIEKCYSLGKSFRNSEPNSSRHLPEFTMLEFYKTQATYMDIADDLLLLLQKLAQSMNSSHTINYKGVSVDCSRWEKLSVSEAFDMYAHISQDELFDHQRFLDTAAKKGYEVKSFSYEDIFSQIYSQEIEPHLGMNGYPTLLYDYPKEFAALAQLNKDRKTAQRFEFYISGVELGDCYTELTDPSEQEFRFKEEVKKRQEKGLINHPVDWGFVDALKKGLPPCAGIAIGFDRLQMVFVGADSVQDIKLITIEP